VPEGDSVWKLARRLASEPQLPFVTALLDQRSEAGLGNLWVNELAFLTGVSPWTPIGEVDVERLVDRAARMLRPSGRRPLGDRAPGPERRVRPGAAGARPRRSTRSSTGRR
jgi:hypothetical protein